MLQKALICGIVLSRIEYSGVVPLYVVFIGVLLTYSLQKEGVVFRQPLIP